MILQQQMNKRDGKNQDEMHEVFPHKAHGLYLPTGARPTPDARRCHRMSGRHMSRGKPTQVQARSRMVSRQPMTRVRKRKWKGVSASADASRICSGCDAMMVAASSSECWMRCDGTESIQIQVRWLVRREAVVAGRKETGRGGRTNGNKESEATDAVRCGAASLQKKNKGAEK